MFCSRCGSEVSSKSRFCPSCGLDLKASTPSTPTPTAGIGDMELVREALAAEYQLVEELGRGGMALVYRATDRQLEREVAIKVLPFSLAFDAEFVERFQREARTAGQLEHPNIIPIYRVGRSGRVIYFVMKFLRGGSLSAVIAQRGKLSPPEVRRILVEAASALGYAAERGIVHRDIKPDNIMFDEFGHSVLTDFGIAKAVTGQRLTGTGMSIGTPHYMSPEQARAQPIDARSDIYSLGVVAYQALAGSVPYDGEDSFAIGYKHITEPLPTPPLETADERQLYEVIQRMLHKDPRERFQSCDELIGALQGQPIAPVGVAASLVAGFSGSAASPPVIPSLANQPTTPISSATVDRRSTPLERRGTPRRRADRKSQARAGGSRAWLWLVLAVIGGGAGAAYYYLAHGFAPGRPLVGQIGIGQVDTVATLRDTAAAGPPPVALPFTPAGDSGDIRIAGDLPPGTTVYIDERLAVSPVTRVPAGRHVVAFWAPSYAFVAETVTVEQGKLLQIQPELQLAGASPPASADSTPSSAPAPQPSSSRAGSGSASRCEPGPRYDADRCFDEPPHPIGAAFVPVPDTAAPLPRHSILWVQVAPDGLTMDVRPLDPSPDPEFERAARQLAWNLRWEPATRQGVPVVAWTQWTFRPAPQ